MKRYLIIFFTAIMGLTAGASAYYFFASGGSTVSLPNGTTPAGWSVRTLGTDSLREFWVNTGKGINRFFSATEINKYYFPRGARTYADSTRLYGTVLPTYATLSGSETLTNKTISAGSNSITMYTLGAGSGLTMTGGTYNPGVTNRTISLNLSQANTWLATQAFITPSQGDNSTKAATTAYVDVAVTNATASNVIEISGTTQQAAVGKLYIPHNGSLTTITLPTTATAGQLVQVVGEGSGGFRIAQNASQQIVGVGVATTVGTGGYIESTNRYCTISIRYITTNTSSLMVS